MVRALARATPVVGDGLPARLERAQVEDQRTPGRRRGREAGELVQHLPIETLPQGMYFLMIREGDTQRVKKFVKD